MFLQYMGIITVSYQLFGVKINLFSDVMPGKKLINLSFILDLQNYINSLDRWIQMPIHVLQARDQRQRYFNKYLSIVKPMVHKYHHTTSTFKDSQYAFYTQELKKEQLQIVVHSYKQLSRFQIFTKEDFPLIRHNQQYTFLTQKEFNTLVPKPANQIYRINDLYSPPNNQEFPHWGTYLTVNKISFDSVVIKGKGIAKISLGFPTANLKVTQEIEQKLNSYPNGIYLVDFTFANSQSYYGICSVGTNPHYENTVNRRLVEVYVYNDFGQQEFYDAEITLSLLLLLRFQGKFETFDCFLNAMHNDIETGKVLSKKYIPK